jgi:hypothetical protein
MSLVLIIWNKYSFSIAVCFPDQMIEESCNEASNSCDPYLTLKSGRLVFDCKIALIVAVYRHFAFIHEARPLLPTYISKRVLANCKANLRDSRGV